MPYTAKDHESQKTLTLDDFTGGMNLSVPSTLIKDNECALIENMFFDPASGRLRTRYPITKYTHASTGAMNSPVTGIFYWKSFWFFSTYAGVLYYAVPGQDCVPVSLGNLASSANRPVFAPYNDKLLVATGGTVQYTYISTVPQALANVTGGPEATIIFQSFSRLFSSGDSTYPDRVLEGTYADDTTWGATDYGDVGYLDGTSVVAVVEAYEGMYIVFKRGSCGMRTYYVTSLSNTNPVSYLVNDGHSPLAQAGVVLASGRLYVMEENFISSIVGSERQGKLEYDPGPGMKLHGSITATAWGFITHYPRDQQLWFVPNPVSNGYAYIYHYMRNAWVKYTFGASRELYSAFYEPISGYLYLGMDDGHVYQYDRTPSTYQDTAGYYTQTITTKTFSTGNRESVLKAPIVHWERITNGSVSLYVSLNYGETIENWGTLNTAGAAYVYDMRAGGSDPHYVYDMRAAGSDPTYVWDEGGSGHQYKRFDYNGQGDAFQFKIVNTAGATIFDRLVVDVAEGRRY